MLRYLKLVILAIFGGYVLIIVGTPLFSELGGRAAESQLVQDGTMSMGPLDLLAQTVLVYVPIGSVAGMVLIGIAATVARLAFAGRM